MGVSRPSIAHPPPELVSPDPPLELPVVPLVLLPAVPPMELPIVALVLLPARRHVHRFVLLDCRFRTATYYHDGEHGERSP